MKKILSRSRYLRTAFVLVFIAIGMIGIIITRAATFQITYEPEDGIIEGCAEKVTDQEASNDETLVFGAGAKCGSIPNAAASGAKLPISYDVATLPSTALYVAHNGSDTTGNGSVTAPYATFSKAYASAPANGTIVMRGGVYYQGNLTIANSKPVRVIAYSGEIPVLNGAQTATSGWTAESSLTYHAYAPQPVTDGSGISFTSGQNLTDSAVGKYPDQAWVGDTQLRQVAEKTSLTEGTFWVDAANQRLYMTAADRSKGAIEFSQKDTCILVQAPNTTIEGLKITRFSNSANDYGVVKIADTADNSMVRNVEISDSAFMAVSYLGSSNLNTSSTLKNVTIATSNWMGVNAVYTDNLTLDAVKITSMNQFNEFTHSPQSGALKTSRTRHTKVLNSDISRNKSHGLWFDQSNVDVDVAHSRIVDNDGSGLFFEISDGLLLIDNYIRSSGGARAVKLAGSSGLKLVNNTIIGGADPVGIYVDSRSMPGCADPSQTLCAGSYGSDRDTVRTRPATLDWVPRLDLMVNNIIAYPTAAGYCGSTTAVCVTKTNAGATVPISTIIHKADAGRGLPQTYINGNIYANGGGKIFNTEIGNFSTLNTFIAGMTAAPVGIGGFENAGQYGNTWVNGDGSPTQALASIHSQAALIPTDPDINQYLAAGTRHYGSTTN